MKLRLAEGPIKAVEGEKHSEDAEYVRLTDPVITNSDGSLSQFRGILAIPKRFIIQEAAPEQEATIQAEPQPPPRASRRRQKQPELEQ